MSNESAASAPTRFVDAKGVRLAYRRIGAVDGVPLLFLQHFTGTMDSWDPSVVDGFAQGRPVILFDNAGVSRSGGTTPGTVDAMADHALAFVAALGLTRVDLLGFSLGGFVAQVMAARRPDLVRRIILAGTGPEGGEGIDDLGTVIAQARLASPAEPRLHLFFEQTESSQRAGRAFIERQARRTTDRDPESTEQTVGAQLTAIVRWGASSGAEGAERLRSIAQPVLVVNGKSDIMVPTINSYALFQQLPAARLLLYSDSGHGPLFQYPEEFVREGLQFLDC
jgi:pimeloyl-ACP methyl ester carboxylesterase